MKAHSLFLSYNLRDKSWADRFASALRAEGFEVHQASEAPVGGDWQSWLRSAIAEADAVVAVLSDEEEPSPWVLFETGAAEAGGKKVIPVVLGTRPVHLPLVQNKATLAASFPEETAKRLATHFSPPKLLRRKP